LVAIFIAPCLWASLKPNSGLQCQTKKGCLILLKQPFLEKEKKMKKLTFG